MCHVVSRSAVPIFFLISGYYFFYGKAFTLEAYKQKIKKRVRTLLVPYILWNTLLILVTLARKIAAVMLKGKPLSSITDYFSQHGWLDMYWSCQTWGSTTTWLGDEINPSNWGPILVPMWFMRDLMVVCLFAPLIYWLIRKCGKVYILVLFLVYLSKIWIYLPGISCTAFLFFSWGAFYAIHGKNMVEAFHKVRIPVCILYFLLLIPSIYYDGPYTPVGSYLYPFFVVSGVVTYINLAAEAMKRGWIRSHKTLSQSAFFIYGLHMIYVLFSTAKLFTILLPWNSWWIASLRYLLIPIVCVVICYGIYRAIMKWMPCVGKLFMGDR
jgi:fucose 4-O-acetylase-like acetyltransferase